MAARTHWDSIESLRDDVVQGKTTATALVEKALRNIQEATEYKAIIAVIKKTCARARQRY